MSEPPGTNSTTELARGAVEWLLAQARPCAAGLAWHPVAGDTGTRWSNHEHRTTSSDLEPRIGWAMGNAGITRELLRYIPISNDRPHGYAVQWPGHPSTTELTVEAGEQ